MGSFIANLAGKFPRNENKNKKARSDDDGDGDGDGDGDDGGHDKRSSNL